MFSSRSRRLAPRPLGWFCAALVLPLVLAPLVSPLTAQSRTTSALRGTVERADGSPVAGAAVEIRHEGTGATKATVTNDRGQFLVLLLSPGGPYTLRVRHIGFAEERREDLVIQAGQAARVDVVLREEAIELPGLDVEVDRADVFGTEEVGPATRLTERTLESMPILSRDVMELAVLSPLVKTTEGGGFSVAGQNDRYNAILVDGLLSKDMFGLTSGGVPGGQAGAKLIPLDAVSQFEILVAPFDIRLSGFTGGVMNAVTRSGTNEWRVRAGGVHRNEVLMGDLSLPTGPVEASGVDRSLLALSVGGPVVRDRVHFFLAGELEQRTQPPDGFNLLRDDPALVRIAPDSVEAVRSLFDTRHRVDPGLSGPYPLEQSLANVFARADWNFEGGDRITVRHVFARAENDEPPNRAAFRPYELSSNAVFRGSTNHLTALQLFSDFGDRLSNELNVTLQRTADRTSPASDLPQVEVDVTSSVDGVSYTRGMRLGGEFYAHVNDLEQTSLRLTNSLDVHLGEDVLTLGLSAAWYDITHAYVPGARGEYFFASLGDLERDAPYRYQRTVLAEGEEPAVSFDVLEWGAFVQRQIHAGDGLTMHFGLRADVPHVFGRPNRNFDLEAFFGYDTSRLPSANILLSPRWGFNWQSGGERNTQVRGGVGLFSGQVPYVWLSNAFHNDGLRMVTRTCEGRSYLEPRPTWAAPPFDPASPPESCVLGRSSAPPFRDVTSVVVFDPAFRYPQDLKMSVVGDRELGDRLSASLGFLFNKAFNQVGLRDLNLEPGGGPTEAMLALAGQERRYYARLTDDFENVLLVTNEGENWAASLTGELRGTLADRMGFQLGYTLARSRDRMSLVFNDMISNIGLSPVSGDVNKPRLERSNFDRPHKVVAAVYGSPFPGLPDTELSVLYTGQSGLPFTYVYGGDVNGDRYPGLGVAFDRYNDPIHLPTGFDLIEAPISFVSRSLFQTAMEVDPCLAEHVGGTLPRNACRSPWENRLDLRAAHTFGVGGAEVRLEADVINVLNLLNGDWGRVERTRPVIPLLDLCQVACEFRGPLPARWGGGVLPTRDGEGRLRPSDPWTVETPDSQWQMQIGAKVTFGGRRQ